MLKFSKPAFCPGFKIGNFSARAPLGEKEFTLEKTARSIETGFLSPNSADNVKEGRTAVRIGKFWAPSPTLTGTYSAWEHRRGLIFGRVRERFTAKPLAAFRAEILKA